MASNKIQIITDLMIQDSQFQAKAKSAENMLKKLSTSKALIKMKFDDNDFRKQIKELVVDAEKQLSKAFNVKAGGSISYRNKKGNLTSINTESSIRKAAQFALEQSTNSALSAKEQKSWDAKRIALENYLKILELVRESTKKVAREQRALESGRIKGVRDRAAREANREARALKKIENIEKEIARTRVRNYRSGGQVLSNLQKQISLYHQLYDAARVANDVSAQRNARTQITRLNQQVKAVQTLNTLYGRQGRIVQGISSIASRYLSIYTIAQFGKKVAETTGYFQQQQVALEGILGSAAKARDTLAEIKNFALQSPFQTKELVTFTKQLAAFGVANNDLFPTVKKLADISAGLGVDMSRIILAYGQVKSASVLRGQELRQFTEAGIPMVQKLADKFTELNGKLVTTGEVFKLISERQVPFEMVAQVLSDMTAEGGQFYKMQENITNTTYGQIQKLKDLWTIAMDDMGKATSGLINTILKGMQNVVKNIQPIFVMLSSTVIGSALGRGVTAIYRMIRALKIMRVAAIGARGAMTTLLGGIGLVVGAIVGWAYNSKQKSNELKRAMDDVANAYDKDTRRITDGLDSIVQKLSSTTVGTKKYNEAVSALAANYGGFIGNDITEALMKQGDEAKAAADKFLQMADAIKEAIRQQQEWKKLQEQAETAGGKAGEGGKEDAGRKSSNIFGITVSDILSYAAYYGGTSAYATSLPGVAAYQKAHKVSHSDMLETASSVFGNILSEIALEGIEYSQRTTDIRDIYVKRLKGTFFGLDANTIEAIADNAIGSVSDATIKKFNEAASKANAAESTIFAQLMKPFNELDKYLSGDVFQGKSILDRDVDKYNKAFSALARGLNAAGIEGYDNSNLKKLVESEKHNAQAAYDVVKAIEEFGKGKGTEINTNLTMLSDRFKTYVELRSERPAKITQDFLTPGSKVYNWRNDPDLANIVATYGAPTDNDFQKLREQLSTQKSDLKERLKREKIASERVKLQKQINAIDVLQGVDLYAYGDKQNKTAGSGSGDGWRRMFADLFGWLKEARDEEKKLVEFSAGLTEELRNQITSGKLNDTAVNAFWSNTPFKKFIDKIDEYGIESNIMSKEFLNEKLSSIAVKYLETTGTVNWKDIWDELVKIINERADELSSDPNMKSTVDALKNLASSKILEGNKIFSKDKVQSLIEGQLKELRSINAKFNDIKNKREMYDKIAGSSNYLLAQRAIYGGAPQSAYFASRTTQSKLRELFSKDYAKGIVKTDAGAAISALLNGGDMNINNLSVLSTLRQQLTEEVNKYQGGTAEQQATFKELNGVIGTFDGLLDQLLKDILDDFEKLMRLKDPITKSSDDIINSYEELKDAQERIAQGVSDGSISGTRAERMRISAIQSSYGTIVKGIPQYISNLFGAENTSGYTKKGLNFAAALSDNPLIAHFAMKQQEWLNKELQDIENYYDNVDNLPELTGDARDKEKAQAVQEATDMATNSLQVFSDKLMLASKVLDEVGKYMSAMQSATDQIFNTLDAANRVTVDEYGNYTKQNDYDTARATLNTIYDFGKGVTEGVTAILRGDFTGVFKLFESVMKLIENAMGIGDGLLRKQIEKNNSYIKSLDKSLEKLNHTISEAAGNTKFDNLTEQIAELRKKEAAARKNESLERQMKKGDPEAAESYAEQAKQSAMEIEEIVWRIRDEIFGAADEVASTLTEPLVEAFRNGENAARAWRDSVRGYIGDVLKQILMTNVIAPRIKGILASMGIEEGKTSEEDIMSIMSDPTKMQYLQNSLFAAGDQLIDWFNNGLAEPIKEMIAWNSDTSTLSGGIQGITEDTARTLEGLSYSMLAQMVLIQRGVQSLESSAFAQVQTSWFNDMLTQQRAIRQATESINTAISDMRNGIRPLQVRVS